ncbi:MAG: hypothetical protein Q7J79_01845 [Gemmatimonadales bacterium]|nr:hypothetical protein [Gemmatimonadales bacterium]
MAQRVGAAEHGPLPTLDTVRRVVAELAREAGYRLVVLFGSAARGEPAEDLDIGILARGPLDAVAATNRLTPALGTQAVDVADRGRADPLRLMLVAREGEEQTEGRGDRGTGGRVILALNKADRLDEADREDRLSAAQARGWEAVLVSAVTGSGLSDLATAVTLAGASPSGQSA